MESQSSTEQQHSQDRVVAPHVQEASAMKTTHKVLVGNSTLDRTNNIMYGDDGVGRIRLTPLLDDSRWFP